jgi:hypothetical protein
MKRRRRRLPEATPDLFEYVAPVPSAPARASDPETSHAAAARVRVKDVGRFSARTRQAKLLVEFDQKPLTDFEAAQRVMPTGSFHSHFEGCRRRCSDLRAADYLEDSGEKRSNPGSPDEAIVWRITQAGRDALTRLLATGWSR